MGALSLNDSDFTDKILDVSPIGICVLDPDWQLVFANARAQEILGLRLEEMAQPDNNSPTWEMTDLEGNPINWKDFLLERVRETRKSLRGVRLVVQRPGEKRMVLSINVSPLVDDTEGFKGMIVVFEDITDRIELEELTDHADRLQRILDAEPIGVQLVDSEGRNVYANRRAQEILGLGFDELTRRYYHSPEWHVTDMDGNPLEPNQRIFSQVKESMQPLFDRRLMVQRPDEHWIAISVNAQPLLDDSGRFNGLASVIEDITERILLERELEHHREQLEETVRQRTLRLQELNQQLQQEIELRQEREVELESANRRLQALSTFLQSAREKERSRSAFRVHDEIGQSLMVLQMALKNLEKDHLEGEGAAQAMRSVFVITDQLAELVKAISAELRPPILDDAGLGAALEWQAWEFQERTGVSCSVEQGVGDTPIDIEKSTAVFRIFQEIMSNLALQSGIESVKVETKLEEGMLVMTIGVGGDGIDEEDLQRADPLSFVFMCEYAGKFGGEVGIIASKDNGKEVVVKVPV